MRFGRRFQDELDGIPMAPLIDIVFLTLVFFMVTSVYSTLESEIDITLPPAASATPPIHISMPPRNAPPIKKVPGTS